MLALSERSIYVAFTGVHAIAIAAVQVVKIMNIFQVTKKISGGTTPECPCGYSMQVLSYI
jgi:hypothetical protein